MSDSASVVSSKKELAWQSSRKSSKTNSVMESPSLPLSTEGSEEQDVTKILRDLIRLRHKQRLSQAEVARRMGVSRQQVYNIESGRQGDPSARTLERYAKAIGAKLSAALAS